LVILGVDLLEGEKKVAAETLEVSTRVARSQSIQVPVLADPEHEVVEVYGVYNLLGDRRATPSVFIVDEEGVIFWKHVPAHAGSAR